MMSNLTDKQENQANQTPLPNVPIEEAKTNGNVQEATDECLGKNHPLIPVHGIFKDDPTWDEFMENIRENRRKVDELMKEAD
jgi:hypothetical protein